MGKYVRRIDILAISLVHILPVSIIIVKVLWPFVLVVLPHRPCGDLVFANKVLLQGVPGVEHGLAVGAAELVVSFQVDAEDVQGRVILGRGRLLADKVFVADLATGPRPVGRVHHVLVADLAGRRVVGCQLTEKVRVRMPRAPAAPC